MKSERPLARTSTDRAPSHPWTLSLWVPAWAEGATTWLTDPDGRRLAVAPGTVQRGPVVYCAESVDLPDGHDVDAVRVEASARPVEGAGDTGGGRSGRRELAVSSARRPRRSDGGKGFCGGRYGS
ncbi:hypothetical protein [Streptomyces cupreus]|uniref:hypothetical protein n=1 Tax=Streptomyces cupreus TaxID=2759956 RepID=UPI00300C8AB5